MAIEALYQMSKSVSTVEKTVEVFNLCYRLRNIKFIRAMVLDNEVDQKMFLSFAPCMGLEADSWYQFRISSLRQEAWTEHCRGLICLLPDEPEG